MRIFFLFPFVSLFLSPSFLSLSFLPWVFSYMIVLLSFISRFFFFRFSFFHINTCVLFFSLSLLEEVLL